MPVVPLFDDRPRPPTAFRNLPDALAALQTEMRECVRNGGVLVSPFISPGEKDIARAALDAGGAVILMKPDGFPPYFKPHGKYFDLCVQGGLLILACRPPASDALPESSSASGTSSSVSGSSFSSGGLGVSMSSSGSSPISGSSVSTGRSVRAKARR